MEEWQTPQLMIDGMTRDDIKQGILGDCWFLSSCAAVSQREKYMTKVGNLQVPKMMFFSEFVNLRKLIGTDFLTRQESKHLNQIQFNDTDTEFENCFSLTFKRNVPSLRSIQDCLNDKSSAHTDDFLVIFIY